MDAGGFLSACIDASITLGYMTHSSQHCFSFFTKLISLETATASPLSSSSSLSSTSPLFIPYPLSSSLLFHFPFFVTYLIFSNFVPPLRSKKSFFPLNFSLFMTLCFSLTPLSAFIKCANTATCRTFAELLLLTLKAAYYILLVLKMSFFDPKVIII